MKKIALLPFLIGGMFFAQAQEPTQKSENLQKVDVQKATSVEDSLGISKISDNLDGQVPFRQVVDDSVIFNLKKYVFASRIDSLWQQELLGSNLYPKIQMVVQNDTSATEIPTSVSSEILKARLEKIDAKTPFKVVYNSSLEKVINRYLRWRPEDVNRLMALSNYYFPMFEEQLAKYDIPLEIKYLAIVESALNPRAKSWAGATGLWQFMFATGKMHALEVSSYVDERMDPILATEAACKYLSTLYDMFDDWDLALAAYNAGPGNVAQAIRRSGGNKNYWEIRRYLPRETAGYVPAFFASMYLFEYAEEHGFQYEKPQIAHFATDTIHIKELLTFDHISEIIGTDIELLEFLNPSYKLNIIPHLDDEKYYLRLPVGDIGLFVANEAEIYNYVKNDIAQREEPLPRYLEADDKIRYRVRSGDVLGTIAEKHGVRVSQLKKWNHLRGNQIRIGQRLTIYPRKPVITNVSSTSSTKKKNTTMSYTVKKGDSLWSISQKFPGISVQNIKKWNDISGTNLKPGMELKLSQG